MTRIRKLAVAITFAMAVALVTATMASAHNGTPPTVACNGASSSFTDFPSGIQKVTFHYKIGNAAYQTADANFTGPAGTASVIFTVTGQTTVSVYVTWTADGGGNTDTTTKTLDCGSPVVPPVTPPVVPPPPPPCVPNLTASKVADSASITAGGTASFTITVTNSSTTCGATNVVLVDQPGVGLTIGSVAIGGKSCLQGPFCEIGAVAAGATVTVKVASGTLAAGTYTNCASVSSNDTNRTPNSCATVTVTAPVVTPPPTPTPTPTPKPPVKHPKPKPPVKHHPKKHYHKPPKPFTP